MNVFVFSGKRYSCQSLSLKAMDELKCDLDHNRITCVVFMDLSKAFESLRHSLLIAKPQCLWFWVVCYFRTTTPTVYPKKYAHGFPLLCFVMVIHWLILPYPSGLLHWLCGNLTIAPVPAKQPWWIWMNTSREFIMNDCITTTKQSTTKPCAYFLGYTVPPTAGLGMDCTKLGDRISQTDITRLHIRALVVYCFVIDNSCWSKCTNYN